MLYTYFSNLITPISPDYITTVLSLVYPCFTPLVIIRLYLTILVFLKEKKMIFNYLNTNLVIFISNNPPPLVLLA